MLRQFPFLHPSFSEATAGGATPVVNPDRNMFFDDVVSEIFEDSLTALTARAAQPAGETRVF